MPKNGMSGYFKPKNLGTACSRSNSGGGKPLWPPLHATEGQFTKPRQPLVVPLVASTDSIARSTTAIIRAFICQATRSMSGSAGAASSHPAGVDHQGQWQVVATQAHTTGFYNAPVHKEHRLGTFHLQAVIKADTSRVEVYLQQLMQAFRIKCNAPDGQPAYAFNKAGILACIADEVKKSTSVPGGHAGWPATWLAVVLEADPASMQTPAAKFPAGPSAKAAQKEHEETQKWALAAFTHYTPMQSYVSGEPLLALQNVHWDRGYDARGLLCSYRSTFIDGAWAALIARMLRSLRHSIPAEAMQGAFVPLGAYCTHVSPSIAVLYVQHIHHHLGDPAAAASPYSVLKYWFRSGQTWQIATEFFALPPNSLVGGAHRTLSFEQAIGGLRNDAVHAANAHGAGGTLSTQLQIPTANSPFIAPAVLSPVSPVESHFSELDQMRERDAE